jgi:AcrR family transcriptional regulator
VPPTSRQLSGRRAQAARNDELILSAARKAFVADPGAPITAVAKRAGVGISALYTRYGSKEELLRTLYNQLSVAFFERIKSVLRPDVEVHDVSLVFELVAAIKFSDRERTLQLRHRYLEVILDGLRASDREQLPGPPPSWEELSSRWAAS